MIAPHFHPPRRALLLLSHTATSHSMAHARLDAAVQTASLAVEQEAAPSKQGRSLRPFDTVTRIPLCRTWVGSLAQLARLPARSPFQDQHGLYVCRHSTKEAAGAVAMQR